MKNLLKGLLPESLAQNGKRWSTEYALADRAERKRKERWRRADIREALRAETDGKCAYCETRIESGGFMHIDHIVPKGAAPILSHEWGNLTYVCEKCNKYKRDYYDPALMLVNPYNDAIDDHLIFLGSLVYAQLGSSRGEITIDKLRFNFRPELQADKADRLKGVLESLNRWNSESNPSAKQYRAAGIMIDAETGTYSAAVKSLLHLYGFPHMKDESD